jgi:hypothetical protein
LQIKIDHIDRKTLNTIELLIESINNPIDAKVEEKK